MSSPPDQALLRESLRGVTDEHTFGGIVSFMRRRYSRDLAEADVAVLGIPFDLATTNRPGSRFGPRAVREASASLAWEGKAMGWGFSPLDELTIVDYGDCDFDAGNPAGAPEEIYQCVRQILSTDTALLSIGGDHFVSYPLLRAHAERYGELSLIHFDAHSDTWAEESQRIDHGTMFYHAAQEKLISPSHSVQIGLRTHNDDNHGFNVYDAPTVHDMKPADLASQVKGIVGDRPCYLTFDIDCLDPSFAPGTGTPVVGGLSTHQAMQILQHLSGIHLVGMDVVEVAPQYDVGAITSLAAATVALQQLCLFARTER
ncbi:MAG: agmatinase [Luminiphilus sp.]|jgi:agmatinase|nr:agmatinase [Luminiphilus sp.]